MALTTEGAALTEAHRLNQLAIAARAARASISLWKRLDTADLDRSSALWLPAQLLLLDRAYGQSEDLAGKYVQQYRRAEGADDPGPFVRTPFPLGEMTSTMLGAGPRQIKAYIGKGASPASAHGAALNKFTGMVRRQVLSGGRMAIDATTRADQRAIGWRRVTDGNPCAFCAMLASRGPVYASQERASRVAGAGLRYHGHCGCTAEIVYGEWIPSEEEAHYIAEYEAAAKEATAVDGMRTQDTVLHRMRANGTFRDSPAMRNKTPLADSDG